MKSTENYIEGRDPVINTSPEKIVKYLLVSSALCVASQRLYAVISNQFWAEFWILDGDTADADVSCLGFKNHG